MCLFGRKKKEKQLVLESRERITANKKEIDVLLILAENDEKVTSDLLKLQSTIGFLNPSTAADVKKADLKIGDKIGDFKIFLNKASQKNDFTGYESYIKEINILIAERNAKI